MAPQAGRAGDILWPLRHDVVGPLLASANAAVASLARQELAGGPPEGPERLWELPAARRIVARQQPDGRWKYPGGNPAIRTSGGYDQLETYRQLGILVHKYGLDHRHPAIGRAVGFLASFQTAAGDYRGIYGNQYSPNYSAAITELLITAGYASSPQVARTMSWLLSVRQDDGGWAIPIRTLGLPLSVLVPATDTYEPDRTRPSAHLITGIVLRAFAAHPRYRGSAATRAAGDLLKRRFFTRDTYTDHVAASCWLVFSYPFWWTDLLSALDCLTRAGWDAGDPDIQRGVGWFIDHQEPDGFWNTGHNRPKAPDSDLWVALAVSRVLKRCPPADPGTSHAGPARADGDRG